MTTPQAATHKWKTKVQNFEKSTAARIHDILQIVSMEAGEEWQHKMGRKWQIMEDAYDGIQEAHPGPELEDEDLRDEQVLDTYSTQREFMDKAVAAYEGTLITIANRVSEIRAAARGIWTGPTDAQKAAMLVAKRAKVYADVKTRLAWLILEVAVELPVDNLAVANSLENELVMVDVLVSQLETITLEIRWWMRILM